MLQTLTTTLRLLAKRWLTLAEELKALDAMLDSLTSQHARRVRERFGVRPQTAAVLVAVAGDNPERLKKAKLRWRHFAAQVRCRRRPARRSGIV
jgi:hypothetical protein